MHDPGRRTFCATMAASTAAALLEPVQAVERAVKPVRIKDVDIFDIVIPTPADEVAMGKMSSYTVVKIETDVGVRGYSFGGGTRADLLDSLFRPMFVGKDLFSVDQIMKTGARGLSPGPVGGGLVMDNYDPILGAVENAVWDAIGKIAGLPVYRLLGGYRTSIKCYVTCVWRGKTDQSHVRYEEQAEQALRLKKAGYKGMKIRAWRPNPLDDADACGVIRDAVGPDFAIMFDRTADWPGWVWDLDTGVKICRAMEKHNALWMEEPFARNDLLTPRRLKDKVEMLITGGNPIVGLDQARQYLLADAFDIIQPDAVSAGGILMNVKIGHLCECFHVPVTLHGAMGLRLDSQLHISSVLDCPWQELVMATPPLIPEEVWSPALKLVSRDKLFTFVDGEIQVPERPGLGLGINEDAIEHYRVRRSA